MKSHFDLYLLNRPNFILFRQNAHEISTDIKDGVVAVEVKQKQRNNNLTSCSMEVGTHVYYVLWCNLSITLHYLLSYWDTERKSQSLFLLSFHPCPLHYVSCFHFPRDKSGTQAKHNHNQSHILIPNLLYLILIPCHAIFTRRVRCTRQL